MKVTCTVCECDPCDCGWGSYCGTTKNGNVNRVYLSSKSWWECNGGDSEPTLHTSWPVDYDCVEHQDSDYGMYPSSRSYMGKVDLTFKIGDPVRYFPNCNLANDMGVWIVKDVVNKHALDCSWYDYEITNGSSVSHCRDEELMALEG